MGLTRSKQRKTTAKRSTGNLPEYRGEHCLSSAALLRHNIEATISIPAWLFRAQSYWPASAAPLGVLAAASQYPAAVNDIKEKQLRNCPGRSRKAVDPFNRHRLTTARSGRLTTRHHSGRSTNHSKEESSRTREARVPACVDSCCCETAKLRIVDSLI